jgi:hypothetical protein
MWIFSVRLAIGSFSFDADHETPILWRKANVGGGIPRGPLKPGENFGKLGFFSSSLLRTPMMARCKPGH